MPCDDMPDEPSSAAAPAARILIADDDPVFTAVAGACLEAGGYEIVVVSDGAMAMETLMRGALDQATSDQAPFDLALIDLVMPQIDGLRLIALIRATPKLRTLPIIVVTSQQDATLEAEGMRVGANAYLTKPVDWAELKAVVARLLAPH